MKFRFFLLVAVVTGFSSCSSHCNIEKWRNRRYVEATITPADLLPKSERFLQS